MNQHFELDCEAYCVKKSYASSAWKMTTKSLCTHDTRSNKWSNSSSPAPVLACANKIKGNARRARLWVQSYSWDRVKWRAFIGVTWQAVCRLRHWVTLPLAWFSALLICFVVFTGWHVCHINGWKQFKNIKLKLKHWIHDVTCHSD
jgi:hypothetical protein